MPFFSIIIPTYNRAHIITRAIDSVLAQSFSDYEIIIVDDGSTDNTGEILKKYSSLSFSKFFYQENKGVSAARNLGALNAIGKYLIFLDSDDEVEENWLFDFYDILKDDSYTIAYCDMKIVNPDNSIKIKRASNPFGTGAKIGINIPGSWAVIKSTFINCGLYDEFINYGENHELLLRIKKNNSSTAFVNKINFIYYLSHSGGSKNNLNKLNSILYVLQKHQDYFRNNSGTHKLFTQVAAVSAARLGMYKKANELFRGLLLKNKTDFKLWLQYLITLNSKLTKIIWR